MRAIDFDAWFLDLDGVVYIGHELLPGVPEALARLRALGKQLRFLTNDPRPTREELVKRLQGLGIEADVGEVVTCGWVTAQLLPEIGVRSAFIVGSEGLAEEVRRAGVVVRQEGPVDAVVVGADEQLGFREVAQACLFLQRGARFIATNVDGSYPMPFGAVPATGAVVSAIQAATGRRPLAVGKPLPPMFQQAQVTLPPGARALVVGDRVESDILGAHRAGLPAILVSKDSPIYPVGDPRRPDAVVRSLLEAVEHVPELPESVAPADWPDELAPGVFLVLTDYHHERVALVSNGNEWVLPWTILEPVESLPEAAQRLGQRLVGDTRLELGPVLGLCSTIDDGLVTRPDGARIRLSGPCYFARVRSSDLTSGAEWFALSELPTTLRPGHRLWIQRSWGHRAGSALGE